MFSVDLLLAILFGYLMGSVPWALVLVKWRLGIDIRTIGSGNVGANNVLRTGKKGLAAATLALDCLKGAIPCWVFWFSSQDWFTAPNELLISVAGLSAFLGHLYPVWLKGKGGKGVATALGVMLGTAWHLAVAAAVIWIATTMIFRISSLSALVSATLISLLALGFVLAGWNSPETALLVLVMAILIFWRHRTNIGRLRAGVEPKIGHSRKDESENSPN